MNVNQFRKEIRAVSSADPLDQPIRVRLPKSMSVWWKEKARTSGKPLSTLIVELMFEKYLQAADADSDASSRLNAEMQLLAWVRQVGEELKNADDWDEHVTFHIFERIKTEAQELYRAATNGIDAGPLHRKIGSLIRECLGADVKRHGDKIATGQPLRRQNSIIRSYALLIRPESVR